MLHTWLRKCSSSPLTASVDTTWEFTRTTVHSGGIRRALVQRHHYFIHKEREKKCHSESNSLWKPLQQLHGHMRAHYLVIFEWQGCLQSLVYIRAKVTERVGHSLEQINAVCSVLALESRKGSSLLQTLVLFCHQIMTTSPRALFLKKIMSLIHYRASARLDNFQALHRHFNHSSSYCSTEAGMPWPRQHHREICQNAVCSHHGQPPAESRLRSTKPPHTRPSAARRHFCCPENEF